MDIAQNGFDVIKHLDSLPVLESMPVGFTGYLDCKDIRPTSPVMQGVDECGRSFYTICAQQVIDGEVNAVIFTLFQRYSDHVGCWTAANNYGLSKFVHGAMGDADLLHFFELVYLGSTSFVREGEVFTYSLLHPDEVFNKSCRDARIARAG